MNKASFKNIFKKKRFSEKDLKELEGRVEELEIKSKEDYKEKECLKQRVNELEVFKSEVESNEKEREEKHRKQREKAFNRIKDDSIKERFLYRNDFDSLPSEEVVINDLINTLNESLEKNKKKKGKEKIVIIISTIAKVIPPIVVLAIQLGLFIIGNPEVLIFLENAMKFIEGLGDGILSFLG